MLNPTNGSKLPSRDFANPFPVSGNLKKKNMKFKLFLILSFLIVKINAQNYSTNFNVNLENSDIKNIASIWQSYLKTNSKEFWLENEVKNYQNFNILDMSGILNPSLMNWGFNNRILSINAVSDNKYLIKSIFESENKEVFAITNVIATKKNGEFKLSNYIFESTKNWKSTDTSNIIYIYRQAYILSNEEVFLANKFYSNICSLFDIKPEKLTYFIAENCDNIYEILGYEYIFSKGMSEECGYFETKNNFIFATEKAGANHYHEITHYINKYFPNANELLLTGISAYISKDKAHFGKSLIYHTKRVNEYLSLHNEIDLSKPFEFYKLDENTNPQYVIGAVLCDLILEKGGKKELISAFQKTKTDDELLFYLKSKIFRKGADINIILRKKIAEIVRKNEFPENLNL